MSRGALVVAVVLLVAILGLMLCPSQALAGNSEAKDNGQSLLDELMSEEKLAPEDFELPFTAETNYMSLQGCLRVMYFVEEGTWLPPLRAVQLLNGKGAVLRLSCRDAMILNGCRAPL